MKERKSMGYMIGLFIGFLLGCSFGVLTTTNKLKRNNDNYYKEGYNAGYNQRRSEEKKMRRKKYECNF